LHERTKLYECHTDINSLDFQTVAAEMVVNEKNGEPELKNCSKKTWLMIDKDGNQSPKSSGKTVPLKTGTLIIFGNTQGEIK